MTKPLSTEPGFVNRNGQVAIRNTNLPGNDYGQKVYQIGCSGCGEVYGANGADIFELKCPKCGDGRPGLPLS
jgi:PHP family Zn ribbon phosphoesterase